MPVEQKKAGISLKLPPWLIAWLDSQPESRAVLIEQALCKIHKLKPPKVENHASPEIQRPDSAADV